MCVGQSDGERDRKKKTDGGFWLGWLGGDPEICGCYFWKLGWDGGFSVDGFVLLGLTATAAGRTCGAGKWADFFSSFLV